MLGHFPDPLPDELLLSVCTRYADHMYSLDRRSILTDLFGKSDAFPALEFPTRLQRLVEQLPAGHSYSVDL